VLLIRDLIAMHVILCGTAKQSRYSSVNILTCEPVQGSEVLSRNLIKLLRDDRGARELSGICSKIYHVFSIDSIFLGGGDTYWGGIITIYSVVHLIPFLIYGVAEM
jgi:hypothetical protein